MSITKEEATKYMMLMVEIQFNPFPKNLKQEEQKIEKFLNTIDHFLIQKYRKRSTHPSVNRTVGLLYQMLFMNEGEQRITVKVLDKIRDYVEPMGYGLDVIACRYVELDDEKQFPSY